MASVSEEPMSRRHSKQASGGKGSPSTPQILSPSSATFRTSLPQRPSIVGQDFVPKDFSKLLRPEIYHPLMQLETPSPFRTSAKQLAPDTPLSTLLSTGHFRAAAIRAAQQLTTTAAPSDHQTIFELFYIRSVCLILCGSTAFAAQEVKALEDLNSSTYRDDVLGSHLVPWELRVLTVRLQGIGFNDPRRCVMGYYDLAREARLEISKVKGTPSSDEEKMIWESRLEDLGIRVASALVEMEDLDGAAYHLSTLQPSDDPKLRLAIALLWLQIGDLTAARGCASGDADIDGVVSALSNMADGKYNEAVQQWRALCDGGSGNEMYAQNLAVCLVYSGRMDEVTSPPSTPGQVHALTIWI
ncbi:MAG: hypothetical protein M1818_008221 [Claussenomyces sp. TS43310]|nr:MAG: hypothetical protein M1818_008221 [Claussenomyces sp. TS43310]